MSKILSAECLSNQVTVGESVVAGVTVVSKGVGSSEGVLLMQGGETFYLTSNATDLETTLEKLISSINKIGTILTAIGAGMTGPTTAPPGTLATDVIELTAIATELETLKGMLK